ncbi:NACHT domain-containing protein [Deinococcus yunweiensis]|uniref:NACHT domain-containing protein n=1 Tax=Deinococcus yunweiensis TaxID=367282 RepID=UPI00398E850C
MFTEELPWRRYWSPSAGDTDGFLYVPREKYRKYYTVQAQHLSEIEDTCALLLGDAALGKSRTTEQFCREAGQQPALRIDLLDIESAAAFRSRLQNDPVFTAWQDGKGSLTLVLDSLDELANFRPGLLGPLLGELQEQVEFITLDADQARTLLDGVTAFVVRPDQGVRLPWSDVKVRQGLNAELRGELWRLCPASRLHLRIACRSTDLPSGVKVHLERLYDEVGTYHLLPLRREDARTAAAAHGISPEAFLAAVEQRHLEGLASRPMSLLALLEGFRSNGELEGNLATLYDQICLSHASDVDHARFTPALSTSGEERVQIASRLAVFMLLTNAPFCTFRVSDVADALPLSTLEHRSERLGDRDIQITPIALKESLRTALFSGPASGQFRWAHRSFGEFLAARYLHRSDLDAVVLAQLLLNPVTRRAVPALGEVAVHLANLNADFRVELLRADPLTALRADLTVLQDEQKAEMVATLLSATERGLALPPTVDFQRWLWKLAHPGLAAQLLPILQNAALPFRERELAAVIAAACPADDLATALLGLALSAQEPVRLRSLAVRAVRNLKRPEVAAHLRPALQPEMPDDPRDNLRGVLLEVLWPEHLTARDLLDVLTPVKHEPYGGAYQGFLHGDEDPFVDHLTPADMPAALGWAQRHLTDQRSSGTLSAATAILNRAWVRKEDPLVRLAFLRTLAAWIEGLSRRGRALPDADLDVAFRGDDGERHALLLELLQALKRDADDYFEPARIANVLTHLGLLTPSDAEWCAAQMSRLGETSESQVLLAGFIRLTSWGESVARELRLHLMQDQPWTSEWFMPLNVSLVSSVADQMREEAQYNAVHGQRQSPEPKVLPEDVEARLMEVLNQSVDGHALGWWTALEIMQASDTPQESRKFKVDEHACWQLLSSSMRARLFAEAATFLHSETPRPPDDVLCSNTIRRTDIAGYAALALLVRHDRKRADALSPFVWQSWAPTVIVNSLENTPDERERGLILRHAVFRHAPAEMLQAYRMRIGYYAQQGHFLDHQHLKDIWNPQVEHFVLVECRAAQGTSSVWAHLLFLLLEQGSAAGNEYALQCALGPEVRAAQAATMLLTRGTVGWPQIATRLQSAPAFRSAVFAHLDSGFRYAHLDAAGLAELFRLVVADAPYPRQEDEGTDTDTIQREPRYELKNALLNQLVQVGTVEAVAELQAIRDGLPELRWLNSTVERAMAVAERMSWRPLTAGQVQSLLDQPGRRVVEDARQLLAVIRESLGRMMAELRSEFTPTVNFLWNEWQVEQEPQQESAQADTTRQKRKTTRHWKPKDEERLSDWIKVHLERDLKERRVIVNREAQIRRGQFTDVLVSALKLDRRGEVRDRIDVIIEVKGSWHSEVLTAMETQLAGTYLRESRANVGLYLVGWYYSPPEEKRKPTGIETMEELQSRLDAQASSLLDIHVEAQVVDLRFKRPQPELEKGRGRSQASARAASAGRPRRE